MFWMVVLVNYGERIIMYEMMVLIFVIDTIYLFINWRSFKKGKVSPWITNVEIIDKRFFRYQLVGSVIVFFLILIGSSLISYLTKRLEYFSLIVLMFWILNYIIKRLSLKKGYILKKE